MRTRLIGGLAALTLLPLAACSTGASGSDQAAGTGADQATASAGAGAESDAFPVTIKTAFGPTTIKKKPTRIATVGWSDQDILAALGIAPIGAPEIQWGGNKHGSTQWFDAQLKKIGGEAPTRYDDSAGAPVDEIGKLAPDLILATNSGLTKDEYKTLSKIAPVVAYPGAPYGTSWQKSTRMVGKAIGQPDAATKLIKKTEQKVDDAVAKYPQIKGTTASWLWFTPTDLSKIGVYTTTDNRQRLLEEFGFSTPSFVQKLTTKKPNAFSVEVSSEKAATVKSDIVIFGAQNKAQVKQITGSPLAGKIPAIKRGDYVASTEPTIALPMSSPSPLSIPFALKHFLPKLAAAAK